MPARPWGPTRCSRPSRWWYSRPIPTRPAPSPAPPWPIYLRAPNYLRNLTTLGFDESDWSDYRAASDRLVDAIVAWGTGEQIRERVDAHRAAGADHVCVQVLRADMELPRDEWRILADVLVG